MYIFQPWYVKVVQQKMGWMIKSPSSCLGALLVLGLVLNVAVISNAGKSSSFVRKVEKSVDMPLDSDVFRLPPGHNAPQQVPFLAIFPLMLLRLGYLCPNIQLGCFMKKNE